MPMKKRRIKQSGVSLVVSVMCFMVAVALASLGMDYGRVQLAKSELRQASMAGARAAATALGSVTAAQNLAVQFAGYNTADGTTVVVDPNTDIIFGTWNTSTKSFATLSGISRANATAIKVYAVRTAARGTGVPLLFGSAIGMSTCDIANVWTTVFLNGDNAAYGIVGLNSISLSGAASQSYFSSTGASGQGFGNIASNGNISLSGGSRINGAAYITSGHTVSGANGVTGGVKTLGTPLSYANADAGSYATTNDDANMGSYISGTKDFSLGSGKSLTLPGGVYYVHNFAMSGSASLTFTGPATVYFYGTFNMSGSTTTKDSIPNNLKIIGCMTPTGGAPGSLTLSGSSALAATIYAPQSDITLSGSSNLYGTMLGKKVTQSGSSTIMVYNDLSAPGNANLLQVVQ